MTQFDLHFITLLEIFHSFITLLEIWISLSSKLLSKLVFQLYKRVDVVNFNQILLSLFDVSKVFYDII